ncbi:MAG: hypothetical protein ACOYOI_02435 [Chthoniobacterales bacterium]
MDPFHLPSLTFCNLLGDVLYRPSSLLRFLKNLPALPIHRFQLESQMGSPVSSLKV